MRDIVTCAYPLYSHVKNLCYSLAARYPFLECKPIGQSILGRDIYGLFFGNQNNSVLYVGGIHGAEWLNIPILLKFTEDLCYAFERGGILCSTLVRKALKGKGAVIVPCMNPDGTEIALCGPGCAGKYEDLVESCSLGDYRTWQSNARGVDLNHNFDAGWSILSKMEKANGITGPSKTQYGGTGPESEPESRCITTLCRTIPFRHLIAFHSQGEEIYWNYGDDTPEGSEFMAQILSSASGYEISTPSGLASHGGLKDWFIDSFKRPAFTVETGYGTNPLPLESFEYVELTTKELMLLGLIM